MLPGSRSNSWLRSVTNPDNLAGIVGAEFEDGAVAFFP